MTRGPDRRRLLQALGAAAGGLALPRSAAAAPLAYALQPSQVAPGTWVVFGAREDFSRANGGAIVNCSIVDTGEGAVIVDTGSSARYGQALRALAEQLTGKPVARVYVTHSHPDHILGAQAFAAESVASLPAVNEAVARDGDAFATNLYALLGDWMRGTAASVPGVALAGASETIGGHDFVFVPLAGHTAADLAILDRKTGVLFAGDIVFLDRALTTPQARPAEWFASLDTLGQVSAALVVPGHGPAEPGRRAIEQTRDYLSWLVDSLTHAVDDGLDEIEAMALPIPDRFGGIALARHELARSVVHLYPKLEAERLPLLSRRRG
ncbi:MAG: quinoprotein relay system zinc metallohydrolase 1 [Alsobacter sp.]